MRACEAVRRSPVTLPGDTTLRAAAAAMERGTVGAVVVTDGETPVGIVTDRDLVVRGLATGNVDGRLDSVMSTALVTAEADADLRDVVRCFATNAVRRIVLVRDGVVAGVLSVDDLVVDLVADLGDVVRPITAEVLFGHHDAPVPARVEPVSS